MVFGKKKDPYEEVAERILSLSESPTLAIFETLVALRDKKKKHGAVFMATKIFGINYGVSLTDYGFYWNFRQSFRGCDVSWRFSFLCFSR